MGASTRNAAEAVLAVANSRHGPEADLPREGQRHDFHDHLESPATAVQFLRSYAFDLPAGAPRPEHLASLRRVREAAHALAADGGIREWRRRTEPLLRSATYRIDASGELVPEAEGWDAFIAALLPGLVALRRDRERLKVCGNPSCRWLFIDRSKNQSRVWCEMASCGNRMKLRRYRRRQRATAAR